MSNLKTAALELAKKDPKFREALRAQLRTAAEEMDEEEWAKVHQKMANIMASKLKDGKTHSFWASTVSLPRDVGHGMYWQFGTQMFPKGKNAYLSIYTPMFSRVDRSQWSGLYMDLGDVLRKAERVLKPFGKVKFNIADKATQLWLDLAPGKDKEVEKVLLSLTKRLADVTDRFVKHEAKKSNTASLKEAATTRLIPSLKRAINKDLNKAGLDGNGRFRKPEEAYSRALEVLAEYGIELDEVVSSHLFKGDKGSLTIDVAFTNPQDSFSPDSISNSVLRLDFTNLGNRYEVIGYMS